MDALRDRCCDGARRGAKEVKDAIPACCKEHQAQNGSGAVRMLKSVGACVFAVLTVPIVLVVGALTLALAAFECFLEES